MTERNHEIARWSNMYGKIYSTEEEAVSAALRRFGEDSWAVRESDQGWYILEPGKADIPNWS